MGNEMRTLVTQILFFIVLSISAQAQCAMCQANLARAENAAVLSGRVNSAILVLLLPTLLILGGVIRLIFKYRNYSVGEYDDIRSSGAQRRSK